MGGLCSSLTLQALPTPAGGDSAGGGGSEASAAQQEALAEQYQQLKRTKNRILGVVKLIGELFQRKILGFPIVRDVVVDLVIKNEEPDEHFIECFVQLIATTGKVRIYTCICIYLHISVYVSLPVYLCI